MIKWQWSSYNELSQDEIYEILKIRQAVFIVEQKCAYQDADDLDSAAWHLMGWHENTNGNELAAYVRVVFPGKKYPEPSIGRVLTSHLFRGTGLGKSLIIEAIAHIKLEYPDMHIRISAQKYLEKFYSSFGFKTVSDQYYEDGIPHIEMLKSDT
ncbi:MAG TPA: GNAT family N-acetyltransferase [Victivallales bacterium]|nr:GNAT family N-acetyltransferase [Victivallales bacterium]